MTTSTRLLKEWSQANTCDACKRLPEPVSTLATHSTTDSHEKAPGVYEESKPRFGCAAHAVAPMVFYLNGDVKPLSEVLSCQ